LYVALETLTAVSDESIAFVLNTSEGSIMPVKSWSKTYEVELENGETVTLTEQDVESIGNIKRMKNDLK